jgi:2-isopropylmalate synthase
MGMPTATVRLQDPEQPAHQAAVGTGPVDAAYKAIDAIVG